MILLREAIQQMNRADEHHNPVPFALTFCTADRSRRTGGEVISLPKAVLMKRMKKTTAASGSGTAKKKSNDFENATRNVLCLDTQRPYRVHLRLIESFNNTPVLW
jgi:hypothetical protein